MNKKGKKRALIGNGTLIGAAVAALLILFLLNPNWLPFSDKTTSKIAELEKTHFLIERSGEITAAHWLTLLLDGTAADDDIRALLETSFALTWSKPKRKKP